MSESKCKCTNCSEYVTFPNEMAGQTAECPHCHFETILFIPPGQKPTPQSKSEPRASSQTVSQSQTVNLKTLELDESILTQGNISVTRTRLMIGPQTYAISAITSMRVVEIPRAESLFMILLVMAGIFGVAGFIPFFVADDIEGGLEAAVPLFSLGILAYPSTEDPIDRATRGAS